MKITSRAMSMALLTAVAFMLLFAGVSFAAEKCDPAACSAECQAICKDTTLTEAQRLEKCKEVCKDFAGKGCSEACKAKCEQAGTAACPHGAKADANGEAGLIKNASATTSECPHAKGMMQTAEAGDNASEATATTAAVKSECAKTCGAEAAKACAATKKSCVMSSKEKEKPE